MHMCWAPARDAAGDMAKNQLLAEMDNLAPQEVVLVLAATHRAEDLEPVALRPGRFDRCPVGWLDNRGHEAVQRWLGPCSCAYL